ncbi:glycine zipper 2TM domain-containing protein [Ramlibacter sp. PS4R-6]|uniref:glycine zipper 2TM domain-containing protein n=1 Tax=Ramlibacter sp. PS4R-6 TaxID=3133438 RepID=UPI003098C11B
MNKAIWMSAMGAIGLAAASAASAQEVGRVISSTPVVQQVPVQRQVCNQQPVVQQQAPQGGGAGAVIGAIAGGLLGHTVGGGMGNAVATGIGVVAGAAVGDNLERNRSPQYVQGPGQCQLQVTYENRTVGYNVEYEYAGKTFKVQMPYDPGPTVRLQVTPMASNAPATAPSTSGVQTISAPAEATAPVYLAQTPSVVYPAYGYPAYAPYPGYYGRPYWYPPISLSLGYVWHGGGRHRWR